MEFWGNKLTNTKKILCQSEFVC